MIYFVRHGESEANLRGVFAGQKDNSNLTQLGKEQASKTAKQIGSDGIVIDRIITSPLNRTVQTANIIADQLGFDPTKIEVDPRMTEYDMGSLTGSPLTKISSITLISAENAEDILSFQSRVQGFLDEYSKSTDSILLVSSAGVGRIIETIKTKGDPTLFYDLPAYANGSITKIDWIK